MQAKPFIAGREGNRELFFRQHFSLKNVTFPNSIKVAPFPTSNLTQLSKMLISFSHALQRVYSGERRKNREKLNRFDRPIRKEAKVDAAPNVFLYDKPSPLVQRSKLLFRPKSPSNRRAN